MVAVCNFVITLTCMWRGSSGCSPIRPSVIMWRFPASLDVWEDREDDEWRIEPWRFRGLQGRGNGEEIKHMHVYVTELTFISHVDVVGKRDQPTDLCLCMRRTLSGLMWLWEERMLLEEFTPWHPAGANRSMVVTPCWEPTIYCSEYLHRSQVHLIHGKFATNDDQNKE